MEATMAITMGEMADCLEFAARVRIALLQRIFEKYSCLQKDGGLGINGFVIRGVVFHESGRETEKG